MIRETQIFMLGFLSNAIVWRLDVGQMEDIKYPVILSVLCVLMIAIQQIKVLEEQGP